QGSGQRPTHGSPRGRNGGHQGERPAQFSAGRLPRSSPKAPHSCEVCQGRTWHFQGQGAESERAQSPAQPFTSGNLRTHRMNPSKAFALAALVLSLAVPALAATDDIGALADRYLTARARLGGFNGAVLIARDGRMLLRKGYGFADVEKRIPYTFETQHAVAS